MSFRRAVVALICAGWLAVGAVAAYGYVHDYDLYRGFGATTTPPGIARGTVREVSFFSPSIGREDHYIVYLPPHYAAEAARGRRFPVLYLLHGSPGKMTVFTTIDPTQVFSNVLIAHHRMPPTILVAPGGAQGLGGDMEWANTSSGRWMDFVMDVVHDVDSRFATLANRQHRGIAGDSEGGYGALNIGLRHLGDFSVIESWGGYFAQTPTGVFANATRAQLAANSPTDYVDSLAPRIRRLGLRVWLLQGRHDTQNPQDLIAFAGKLHAARADVRYGFFPGGHDWGLFRARTPRMLIAAGRWFERKPGASAGLRHVGSALTPAQLRKVVAHRRRRCLALRPGPGVHITSSCRAYRRAHGIR